MNDESSKLEKLRRQLTAIKNELDDELIPLGEYLGEQDGGLLAAMENLSKKIAIYFDQHQIEE